MHPVPEKTRLHLGMIPLLGARTFPSAGGVPFYTQRLWVWAEYAF